MTVPARPSFLAVADSVGGSATAFDLFIVVAQGIKVILDAREDDRKKTIQALEDARIRNQQQIEELFNRQQDAPSLTSEISRIWSNLTTIKDIAQRADKVANDALSLADKAFSLARQVNDSARKTIQDIEFLTNRNVAALQRLEASINGQIAAVRAETRAELLRLWLNADQVTFRIGEIINRIVRIERTTTNTNSQDLGNILSRLNILEIASKQLYQLTFEALLKLEFHELHIAQTNFRVDEIVGDIFNLRRIVTDAKNTADLAIQNVRQVSSNITTSINTTINNFFSSGSFTEKVSTTVNGVMSTTGILAMLGTIQTSITDGNTRIQDTIRDKVNDSEKKITDTIRDKVNDSERKIKDSVNSSEQRVKTTITNEHSQTRSKFREDICKEAQPGQCLDFAGIFTDILQGFLQGYIATIVTRISQDTFRIERNTIEILNKINNCCKDQPDLLPILKSIRYTVEQIELDAENTLVIVGETLQPTTSKIDSTTEIILRLLRKLSPQQDALYSQIQTFVEIKNTTRNIQNITNQTNGTVNNIQNVTNQVNSTTRNIQNVTNQINNSTSSIQNNVNNVQSMVGGINNNITYTSNSFNSANSSINNSLNTILSNITTLNNFYNTISSQTINISNNINGLTNDLEHISEDIRPLTTEIQGVLSTVDCQNNITPIAYNGFAFEVITSILTKINDNINNVHLEVCNGDNGGCSSEVRTYKAVYPYDYHLSIDWYDTDEVKSRYPDTIVAGINHELVWPDEWANKLKDFSFVKGNTHASVPLKDYSTPAISGNYKDDEEAKRVLSFFRQFFNDYTERQIIYDDSGKFIRTTNGASKKNIKNRVLKIQRLLVVNSTTNEILFCFKNKIN